MKKKTIELPSLERTIKKVAGQNGEDTRSKMKTPLSAPELWEVLGGGCIIKAFGHIFPGREYVLAKTHAKALELARIKTGIDNIKVMHQDYS